MGAIATTRSWTGAASLDWSDPGNWDRDVPGPGGIVQIPSGVANPPSILAYLGNGQLTLLANQIGNERTLRANPDSAHSIRRTEAPLDANHVLRNLDNNTEALIGNGSVYSCGTAFFTAGSDAGMHPLDAGGLAGRASGGRFRPPSS